MTGAEILLITAIAGAGVAAYGQYQQGKTAQSQAKAQSAWNMYNAKVSQREAEAEDRATAFDVAQAKRRADEDMGRLRAGVGAANVTMEGSPLLAAEDLAAQHAKEITNVGLTGQRRAGAFTSQSILDTSMASAARSRAAGFGQAAVINAGGTLLQGTAQSGYQYNQMTG